MSRKRPRITQIIIFSICLWISSGLIAGSLSDSFKAYVLDSEQTATIPIEQTLARLPVSSSSIQCMECHDGSKATGVVIKHADQPMTFTGHGSVNHPVGMIYSDYANKNPAVFVSPERLDERIVLENGEVTCLSCHALKKSPVNHQQDHVKISLHEVDVFAAENCTAAKSMTTGQANTTLCLSCHAM